MSAGDERSQVPGPLPLGDELKPAAPVRCKQVRLYKKHDSRVSTELEITDKHSTFKNGPQYFRARWEEDEVGVDAVINLKAPEEGRVIFAWPLVGGIHDDSASLSGGIAPDDLRRGQSQVAWAIGVCGRPENLFHSRRQGWPKVVVPLVGTQEKDAAGNFPSPPSSVGHGGVGEGNPQEDGMDVLPYIAGEAPRQTCTLGQ